MGQAKLMKPLFDGWNFNQAGHRMRAVFLREVTNGAACFRLWQRAGKRDVTYPKADNDEYLLFVEVNGYLVPLRETEYSLIAHCGLAPATAELYGGNEQRSAYFDELEKQGQAVDEVLARENEVITRYGSDPARQADFIQELMSNHIKAYQEAKECGGETWLDFAGAVALGELDTCMELNKVYKARCEAQKATARQEELRKEQAYAKEKNEETETKIQSALDTLRHGGTLQNERINIYTLVEDGYKVSEYSIINHLMRRFGVKVPLRTQGWINTKLASITIRDGRCSGASYYRRKGGSGSEAFFDYMNALIAAVCANEGQK